MGMSTSSKALTAASPAPVSQLVFAQRRSFRLPCRRHKRARCFPTCGVCNKDDITAPQQSSTANWSTHPPMRSSRCQSVHDQIVNQPRCPSRIGSSHRLYNVADVDQSHQIDKCAPSSPIGKSLSALKARNQWASARRGGAIDIAVKWLPSARRARVCCFGPPGSTAARQTWPILRSALQGSRHVAELWPYGIVARNSCVAVPAKTSTDRSQLLSYAMR